jgi:hypothetical protein
MEPESVLLCPQDAVAGPRQMNPIYTFSFYFFNIYYIFEICSSIYAYVFLEVSDIQVFPLKLGVRFFPMRATYPISDLITLIILGEDYKL